MVTFLFSGVALPLLMACIFIVIITNQYYCSELKKHTYERSFDHEKINFMIVSK